MTQGITSIIEREKQKCDALMIKSQKKVRKKLFYNEKKYVK